MTETRRLRDAIEQLREAFNAYMACAEGSDLVSADYPRLEAVLDAVPEVLMRLSEPQAAQEAVGGPVMDTERMVVYCPNCKVTLYKVRRATPRPFHLGDDDEPVAASPVLPAPPEADKRSGDR